MTEPAHDRGDQLPRLLDITHLAELLGVSPRHVRRLVFERRIPFIKWGYPIRFDPTEIEDWVNRARVAAASRPEGGRR